MKIPASVIPYLTGESFSSGLEINFEYDEDDYIYQSRADILSKLCLDKKIIHLGCADHASVIKRKLKRNKWLHKKLCDAAQRCYGVDISQEGIEIIKGLGYTDVAALNIIEDTSEIIFSEKWDYMLIPEVLEHVNNPVSFLEAIRKKYKGVVDKLVITVPNAFNRRIFVRAIKGIEVINTDHRYWFTPYTLAKVAMNAGLTVDKMMTCRGGIVKRRSFLSNAYYRKRPLLRGDIVMVTNNI